MYFSNVSYIKTQFFYSFIIGRFVFLTIKQIENPRFLPIYRKYKVTKKRSNSSTQSDYYCMRENAYNIILCGRRKTPFSSDKYLKKKVTRSYILVGVPCSFCPRTQICLDCCVQLLVVGVPESIYTKVDRVSSSTLSVAAVPKAKASSLPLQLNRIFLCLLNDKPHTYLR